MSIDLLNLSMDISGHITRREAAKILSKSVRTVDRYLRSGQLSGQKLNGNVYIERNSLEKIIKELGIKTKSKPTQVQSRHVQSENLKTETKMPVINKSEYDLIQKIYKDLEYKQTQLQGANYRVGQLESKLESSVPITEHNQKLLEKEKEIFNLTTRNLEIEGKIDLEIKNKNIIFTFLIILGVTQFVFWLFYQI